MVLTAANENGFRDVLIGEFGVKIANGTPAQYLDLDVTFVYNDS